MKYFCNLCGDEIEKAYMIVKENDVIKKSYHLSCYVKMLDKLEEIVKKEADRS